MAVLDESARTEEGAEREKKEDTSAGRRAVHAKRKECFDHCQEEILCVHLERRQVAGLEAWLKSPPRELISASSTLAFMTDCEILDEGAYWNVERLVGVSSEAI